MVIQVSEVVNDIDMAQNFSILRSTGSFNVGVWESTTETLSGYGVISVAKPRDLEMIPEGDKIVGAMVFHSQQPLYGTHDGQAPGSSDILIWNNHQWRILSVSQYKDYGYYRAVAERLSAV